MFSQHSKIRKGERSVIIISLIMINCVIINSLDNQVHCPNLLHVNTDLTLANLLQCL